MLGYFDVEGNCVKYALYFRIESNVLRAGIAAFGLPSSWLLLLPYRRSWHLGFDFGCRKYFGATVLDGGFDFPLAFEDDFGGGYRYVVALRQRRSSLAS